MLSFVSHKLFFSHDLKKMLLCSLLVVGVFSFVCGAVRPSPVFLPGAPSVNFSLYSGYVTVDAASNRNLFYFFAESQRASRASDPVLMWQTGGPGCSSLLAMMSENGPFRPNASNPLQLFLDDYAWNRLEARELLNGESCSISLFL